jgi:hypothetical protein
MKKYSVLLASLLFVIIGVSACQKKEEAPAPATTEAAPAPTPEAAPAPAPEEKK